MLFLWLGMINFGFFPTFFFSETVLFFLTCVLQIKFSFEQKLRPGKSHFKKLPCPEGALSLTRALLAHLRWKADTHIWITLCNANTK